MSALFLPRVIGHRGAAAHAPENTLASFHKAAELGVRMIECDVKLSQDGVPMIFHDDALDRTTDGHGLFATRTYADLRLLDAGSTFSPAFAGTLIPTLDETLTLALDLGLAVNLEIKPVPGQDIQTAEVALAHALKLWPGDQGDLLVSSFSIESLKAAQRVAPELPRGYLIADRPADWAVIASDLGATVITVDHLRETPETIAAYQATGRPMLAYTVNDSARAAELFALGITGVFSDAPDRIASMTASACLPAG